MLPKRSDEKLPRITRLLPMCKAACCAAGLLASALVQGEELPAIALIIDDMGNHASHGEHALSLGGRVTYAFLPHTPHARRLAERAHREGKEVMLHLPMDSYDGNQLGPGALTLHMTERAFKRTLNANIEAIPHVAGLNNHMGSLLTRHPGAMAWLMQVLDQRPGMFFIDSRTTRETVAEQLALEYDVPNTRRNVFLDNDRDPAKIRANFGWLVRQARQQGFAVGIGHPYPETLSVLGDELERLGEHGVRLISASEIIALQRSSNSWQESSSPSPRVAKSSKP